MIILALSVSLRRPLCTSDKVVFLACEPILNQVPKRQLRLLWLGLIVTALARPPAMTLRHTESLLRWSFSSPWWLHMRFLSGCCGTGSPVYHIVPLCTLRSVRFARGPSLATFGSWGVPPLSPPPSSLFTQDFQTGCIYCLPKQTQTAPAR